MTVWFIWHRTGEYSDRCESAVEPFHTTREGALKHLAALAAADGYQPDPDVKEWPDGVTDYVLVEWYTDHYTKARRFDARNGRMTLVRAEVTA